MDGVKCFGRHKEGERICQLCEKADLDTFRKCRRSKERREAKWKRREEIRNTCGYATTDWDEYTEFDACKAPWQTGGSNRCRPPCRPKEECLGRK